MSSKNIILDGVLVRGLGEGTFFMSIQHYQSEIRKKLGFNAYPGTLNLRVKKNKANLLKNIKPIRINGFKSGNKIFGGADCYKAKIENINGAIIIPHLTKHKKDIIEFVATLHLKSELKLKEGDKVAIKIVHQ